MEPPHDAEIPPVNTPKGSEIRLQSTSVTLFIAALFTTTSLGINLNA
jgi:hypothetical protein